LAGHPRVSPAIRASPDTVAPSRTILFIGDGTGVGQWTAALVAGHLPAVAGFSHAALVDTRNVENEVTDSGASATAYATGTLSVNGAIGTAPDGRPVETLLERAAAVGLATGLVATSRVNHATPAAFASHVTDRYAYDEIARQMAHAPIDVLMGGGRAWFEADQRKDGTDLLAVLGRDRPVVTTAAALDSLQLGELHGLVGLFAERDMPSAPERAPSLARMTVAALTVLDHDPDGFFLMVEGSQIDWRSHDNAPLAELAAEVNDLDAAVRAAVDWAASRPGTRIVVTADHETGGASLVREGNAWRVLYDTDDHTANLVPLFATGPGAEDFHGIVRIDAVGRILSAIVAPRPAEN
jgi:alkaline phosphatase